MSGFIVAELFLFLMESHCVLTASVLLLYPLWTFSSLLLSLHGRLLWRRDREDMITNLEYLAS